MIGDLRRLLGMTSAGQQLALPQQGRNLTNPDPRIYAQSNTVDPTVSPQQLHQLNGKRPIFAQPQYVVKPPVKSFFRSI